MAYTSWNVAGTVTGNSGTGDLAWGYDTTSLQVALSADDGNYAKISDAGYPAGGISLELKALNFAFAIPPGSTINDVEVAIVRKQGTGTTTNPSDHTVKLVVAGSIVGGNKAAVGNWGAEATVTYSGFDSLPTRDQAVATDFGVVLKTQWSTSLTGDCHSVDQVQIRVSYTVPTPPARRRSGSFGQW